MGKAKQLATAIESLTGAPLNNEELLEYLVAVDSLFTKPFLTEDELLCNLHHSWPGDPLNALQGLLEAELIQLAPAGRYRLPLAEVNAEQRTYNTKTLVR